MIGFRVETRIDQSSGTVQLGRIGDLYMRHAPAALRLAYFLTGERELAEDVVQDAFVKVAGRFRYLREPDAFDAYLRRAIVNLVVSHLRRLRLERRELARQRSEPRSHHVDADVTERDAMWRALQALPARQRAAIVLRYYEDLSEREAADILRCSVAAANQLVRRGLAALREQIRIEER
jgi:RNA polymerase sigma-70 factor (sigma-E family)